MKKENVGSVKVIPLGGLEQIGMNITAIEYDDSIVVVDCGLSFPEEEMLGIDLIIPDVTYLKENIDKVKAFVITHGHEDHIGAIPYVLKEVNVPIYATRLTMGLIESKLKEHNMLREVKRKVVRYGQSVTLGDFRVEFIRTNHSIADAAALAIFSPAGILVHTGDFKVDYTPVNGEPIDLQRFAELGKKGVLALMCDSTNALRPGFTMSERTVGSTFDKIFNDNKIDAVIHFAGYKAVGESVKKPLMYYRNNIDSTLTLCEVMNEHNVKNIVFSSSATVYGTPKSLPIKENFDVTHATNPYGETKIMIERILNDLYVSDNTWNIALLRYFNPIGAHKSGLIGENPNDIPNNLMPYIVKVANKELKELSVFGNDYDTIDGTGVRDYIHVVDLAKGHIKALNWVLNNNGIDAFNLGTGNGYSVLELVEAFKKFNNIDVPYKIVGRRDGDIASCYADASKAKDILDWSCTYNIEDMVKDSYNYVKNSK